MSELGEVPEVKVVMFDFFGTLVEYQPDRSQLAYPQTHDLAVSFGYRDDHAAFLRQWDDVFGGLETESKRTLREFSMPDVSKAFAKGSGLSLETDQAIALGRCFVGEWAQRVHPVAGVEAMVKELAKSFTIAVLSNTHDPEMVPGMIDAMGLGDDVAAVVLSVDHGWAKPHSSIYVAALDQVNCSASEVVFVGDNFDADYGGPIDAGMRAFLIDPEQRHSVRPEHRLSTVLDIAQLL